MEWYVVALVPVPRLRVLLLQKSEAELVDQEVYPGLEHLRRNGGRWA